MNILIAVFILLAYTVVMIYLIGKVPPSLSESVFWLPKKYQFIWALVLFAVCFLCVPTYVERCSENTRFLAFLSIAGLAFVGAAPLVKWKEDPMQFNVHQWGAIVCAVCSQLVLVFNQPWLLLCWVPWVLAFVWFSKDGPWKEIIFWSEAVCFASTFAFCLI